MFCLYRPGVSISLSTGHQIHIKCCLFGKKDQSFRICPFALMFNELLVVFCRRPGATKDKLSGNLALRIWKFGISQDDLYIKQGNVYQQKGKVKI